MGLPFSKSAESNRQEIAQVYQVSKMKHSGLKMDPKGKLKRTSNATNVKSYNYRLLATKLDINGGIKTC